jgi:hypothetical protein
VRIVLSRIALPVAVFLAWAPAAHAWSWPVQGPVLQSFAYDEAHPYASGQHRGIDIGAGAADEPVIAPAAGTVSFAGTVPSSGKCVTIETPDGYSVTLTHLGSILVAKGAAVAEQDVVGTIGPSGTPEFARPYVHLGVRATPDPNGYLDPLTLLPPVSTSGSPDADTVSQPSTSGGSSAKPVDAPAPAANSPAPTARGSTVRQSRNHARSDRGRGRASRSRSSHPAADASSSSASSARRSRRRQSSQRSQPAHVRAGERRHGRTSRPVVEPVLRREPTGLDAGHSIRPGRHVSPPRRSQPQSSSVLLPLVCNGLAAVVALAAAVIVVRRRQGAETSQVAGTQVIQLPRGTVDSARAARAA